MLVLADRPACVISTVLLSGLLACGNRTAPTLPAPPEPAPRPSPAAAEIEELVISATGSCGVLADHTARCWGDWEHAMIKVASAASGLRDVAALYVGHTIKLDPQRYYDHLCVRDVRGAVQCWGNNQQGQVGADVSGDAASPTPVDGLSDVVQLALGAQHTCALRRQGEVLCWGSNEYGQVGAGKDGPVVRRPWRIAGLPSIARIAAGSASTCVMTADAHVFCWGQNRNEQSSAAEVGFEPEVWAPREIAVAQGSKELVASSSTVCGIKPSGAVVCWGFVRALLGDAYAKRSSGEVPGLSGVTALGLGDGYACALRAAGEVWCFGKGERGELGGEPSAVTVAPRQVALPGPATRLSVGPETACARLVDGRWYCWGANQHGEISSERKPLLTPTALDLSRVDMAG